MDVLSVRICNTVIWKGNVIDAIAFFCMDCFSHLASLKIHKICTSYILNDKSIEGL